MATSTRAGAADVAAMIRALDREFEKQVRAKNVQAIVNSFYAENATLLPPNHPPVEGRSNILTFFQGMLDAGATDVTLQSTQIESSGDLAYALGNYVLTMAGKQEPGKYVVVYKRQTDGSWKAIADIFSSNQAQ